MGNNQNSVVLRRLQPKFWWVIPMSMKYHHKEQEIHIRRESLCDHMIRMVLPMGHNVTVAHRLSTKVFAMQHFTVQGISTGHSAIPAKLGGGNRLIIG